MTIRWRGTVIVAVATAGFFGVFYGFERPFEPGVVVALLVLFFVGFVGGSLSFRDSLTSWRGERRE